MGEITAAIYARVSSDQQARGNTVASQLAALRDRAKADEVVLNPDHAFVDEGHSGSTLVRPALESLRDAVAGGHIDRIYVLAPDRHAATPIRRGQYTAFQQVIVDENQRLSRAGRSKLGLRRLSSASKGGWGDVGRASARYPSGISPVAVHLVDLLQP